jgi:hypothetical protein
MKTEHFRFFAAIRAPLRLAICGLLAAMAAPVMAAEVAVTDGLVPTKAKYFDKAWQKPGVNLKGYTAVLIRPASVSFSKFWRPRDYGPYGLKPRDVERVRAMYAKAADDVFARVLSKGGYTLATAPGENVLEIQTEVVDLYVNAPNDSLDVLVRTFVRNAGDMRLLITLRDSTTQAVLFHSSDFKRGDETGPLQWASSVYNRSEAERAFTSWARQLERLLD